MRRSKLLVKLSSWGLVTVVVGMVASIGVFAYFAKDLPSPDRVVRREGFATKIYDRNGELLYDVFSDERRNPVDLADIPISLRQATIAIEDKNFYKHTGVDPFIPFRIAWNVVTRGRVIGGSSLTQQLIKNSLLSSERTLTRKLKEFILTIQVERKYNKDQILQMYLNEVPYGGTAYGVESAAQTYLGKSVKNLTLAESVFLAGLPQSPSRYSPFVGKRYIDRSADVLRRMREDGYIDREQEEQVLEEIKQMQFDSQAGLLKAPHFVFYVKEQLIDRYGEKIVEEGGLRVTTTLDLKLQELAQAAVSEEIKKVEHLKITNGAAIALDPKSGQILVMVGSRGWDDPDYDGKFNVVTDGLRQPGSTIKPVVYLAGLRKGYTAATLFMDTQTSFPGGDKPEYVPVNYDGKFRGPILMRDALGNSINIPAVKMLALVGIRDTLELAHDMGFSTLEPTRENLSRLGLSMALGGGEITLLEMANAYNSFANGGRKTDSISILKVTDSSGKVLEEWRQSNLRQVISPEEAFIISSILSDPKAREITFGARSAINTGKNIAVKTGTTNDRKDNWTIGWSPNITVGVWVGNNDNTPMTSVASGVTGAAPIWRRIILEALKDKPDDPFNAPAGIVQVEVDKISGYRSHDGFEFKSEYFIRGTEPTGEDPVHRKVKVCRGEGKLATPGDVASGNFEEKEFFFFKEEDPFSSAGGANKWQEGILNWTNTLSDPRYHPPADYCGSGNYLSVSIQEPSDHGQFGNDVKIRSEIVSSEKIKRVEFLVDGTIVESLTSAPWEVEVHIATTGTHKIEVKAEDEKGNRADRSVEIGVNQPWGNVSPTP